MLPKALQVYREITYNKGPPLKGHPVKSALVNIRGAYIQYEDSIKLITLGNFLGAHGMNQHKSPINRFPFKKALVIKLWQNQPTKVQNNATINLEACDTIGLWAPYIADKKIDL